jgi:membrane-associated phospholipid phosphatase
MVLLFLVSYGVFLTLPVEIVVRAQMEELVPSMSSPFAELFQLVYLLDRPWNAWPSLHVSGSLLIVLFIDYCWSVKEVVSTRQVCLRVTLWLAWVALALSILTTKQHFLWDMVSGALLGVLAWRWYVGPRLHRSL